MTFYGGKELAAAFRTVRGNTIKTAEEIPEDKYGFSPAPGARTVAQTLAHVALSTGIALEIHEKGLDDLKKLNFPELMTRIRAEESAPRSKAELLELLASHGERFATYVEGLTDAFLGERVGMPPGAQPATKSRFEMLLGPKEHEMHHRGQLMVVQRMLGLVPHLTRQFQERMAQMQAQGAGAR
jgi:uncharacterized damage-inducible protein DinB